MPTQAEIAKAVEIVKSAGRYGDTELAHINKFEAEVLKALGGSGSINPDTGQPEYFIQFLLPILQGLGAVASIFGGGQGLAGLFGAGQAASAGAGAAAAGTPLSAGMAGESVTAGASGAASAAGGSFGDRLFEAIGNRIIDSISGKDKSGKGGDKSGGAPDAGVNVTLGGTESNSKVGKGKTSQSDSFSIGQDASKPVIQFNLAKDSSGGVTLVPTSGDAPKTDIAKTTNAAATKSSGKKSSSGGETGDFTDLLNRVISGQLFQP